MIWHLRWKWWQFPIFTRNLHLRICENLVDFLKVTVDSIRFRHETEARQQRARAHELTHVGIYRVFFFSWDKRICQGGPRYIAKSADYFRRLLVLHGRFYVIERNNLARSRCTMHRTKQLIGHDHVRCIVNENLMNRDASRCESWQRRIHHGKAYLMLTQRRSYTIHHLQLAATAVYKRSSNIQALPERRIRERDLTTKTGMSLIFNLHLVK